MTKVFSYFLQIPLFQSEVYVVDNWEVPREEITKEEEPLGKGTFGLVFRGVYSHPVKVRLN